MPLWPSRLVAVVALLAFLAGNSYAVSHAQTLLPRCPNEECCEHRHSEQFQHESEEGAKAAAPTSSSHDSDFPCCPCPGGCAFCSVAKVPSLPVATVPAVTTPCVDDRLDEAAPLYDSPSRGTPTRPWSCRGDIQTLPRAVRSVSW